MATIIIEIKHQQHYIEGYNYLAFIQQPATGATMLIGTAKEETYLEMCEKLEGVKIRLEQLGNNVVVSTKFEPDPNFETAEDAARVEMGE